MKKERPHRRGEGNPMAKLTEAQAQWLIDTMNSVSNYEASIMLDVSYAAVLNVRNGRTWKHLKRPEAMRVS